MTVVRRLAAADFIEYPGTSAKQVTRIRPSPMPSTMPNASATAPAEKMMAASGTVIGGTERWCS